MSDILEVSVIFDAAGTGNVCINYIFLFGNFKFTYSNCEVRKVGEKIQQGHLKSLYRHKL